MSRVTARVAVRAIFVAACAAAVLAAGTTPASAASERPLSARAVPGQIIGAPASEALVMDLPVRVSIRVPAGTEHLWVSVGGRNVTSLFPATGSLRVAHLTRRDGLQYGPNEISVLVQRHGRPPLSDARSFVLVRSSPQLVRLRVDPGPVTSLSAWMAGGSRLSVIHTDRIVRVWLNGRAVTDSLDTSEVTHVTGSLSAGQGLRYGVNVLRILVVEPDQGQYALLSRRFQVPRDTLLPSAGPDMAAFIGERVRFDGAGSRTAAGGGLDYRWKIVSAPPRSHAELRGAKSARPFLTPDRRGRYVIALTVSGGAKRGARLPAMRPRTDRVTLTVAPQSLLVPFTGLITRGSRTGVQVGDTPDGFYPNHGGGMQWLTLDRATLTPTGAGNDWFDGSAHGPHGIDALTSAICHPDPGSGCSAGLNQLVIFSYKPGDSSGPPVAPDQVDAFNQVLQTIGVGPIDKSILTAKDKKLVIVGVPDAGAGSGWYTDGGSTSRHALAGWLMPDTAKQGDSILFRLQPEQPTFDTSSIPSLGVNVMTIRDQRFETDLTCGTGGFQVATVDPIDFTIVDRRSFCTNGSDDDDDGLTDMAKFLNDNAGLGYDVAVQSIGDVHPGRRPSLDSASPDLASYPWYEVGTALSAYGANPDIFDTVDGSYAFLGGPHLERSQVAQSSSAIVTDPAANPPTHESGTLSGKATMRSDGYFMPQANEAPETSFTDSLHDIVFRPSTPWPYTPGGSFPQQEGCAAPGTDAAAYAKALSFIAVGIGLGGYNSDLRDAYVQRNQSQTWSDQKVDLNNLRFESGNGFDEAEFCNLKAELQQEFTWLDNVHGLFDSFAVVLNQSDGSDLVESIGRAIREAVTEITTGAEIGWSVGGFLGNFGSAAILAVDPEATAALAAWEAVVTVYELIRELVSDLQGAPVADQVTSKVQDLESDVASRLKAAANGLYRLRQVISSDYGRLHALGPVATLPQWNVDVPSTGDRVTASLGSFFYSQLMPIPYGVYAPFGPRSYPVFDQPFRLGPHDLTLDTCEAIFERNSWYGIPNTAWMRWMGAFGRDGYNAWFPTTFELGLHELDGGHPYPPKTLTEKMFTPISQGGDGMQIADFIWQQYDIPPSKESGSTPGPPTDIFRCF